MTLQQMVQAIVTVLAVINPVVCGEIFLALTPKLESRKRRRAAINVAFSILIILLGSALIGLKVLKIFGISLDAFRIVGGVIIAYMGLDMLRGGHRLGQAPPRSGGDTDTRGSLAPLVMFAAGPGTIATVVTLAAVHSRHGLPLTALTASVVGAMVTFGVLLLVIEVGSRIGTSTQAAITRFMGLIVTSMGMQFVLAGLKAFMQG
jgi:multiple antibiotic resistance protein